MKFKPTLIKTLISLLLIIIIPSLFILIKTHNFMTIIFMQPFGISLFLYIFSFVCGLITYIIWSLIQN